MVRPPGPRRPPDGEARLPADFGRGQVVETALRLFGEHGYDSVQLAGMQAVARGSGVNRATVYQLFGDRQSLYRATVGLAAERFVDIVTAARDAAARCRHPRDRSRAFLLHLLGGVRRHPAVWSTLTERPRDPQAAATLAAVQGEVRAAIIDGALADGRGGRPPSLTDRQAEWTARFLYGGMAEVLRPYLRESSPADDADLVDFLASVATPGARAHDPGPI